MNLVTGKLIPLNDSVLITDMSFDEQTTASGIIIKSDDGKSGGIRPRWGKVFAAGPRQQDVKVGEWILVEHGRWTRGITHLNNGEEIVVRRVDTNAILATADEKPSGVEFGVVESGEGPPTIRPEEFM